MDKKIESVILIIVGSYFLIGNTIFSLLFNHIGPSYDVPVTPEDYWSNWWNNYGIITIAIAMVGLILIILGIRIFIKRNKLLQKIAEAN
jgi:uncharacterized membrane protein